VMEANGSMQNSSVRSKGSGCHQPP
jgi:hypothetical protein